MLRSNHADYGSIIPDWYVPEGAMVKSLTSEVIDLETGRSSKRSP